MKSEWQRSNWNQWVDVNKGTEDSPDYRSNIVAQETKTYKNQELLAATPPLEALKVILSTTELPPIIGTELMVHIVTVLVKHLSVALGHQSRTFSSDTFPRTYVQVYLFLCIVFV